MVTCKPRTVGVIATVLASVLMLVTGCAQIRLVTYPDSFVWIDSADVRSTMHTMAASLRNLEQLIANETSVGENRELILNELDTLETTALSLTAGKASVGEDGKSDPATNHLLIDDHLDEFTESILLAQVQAQATPPNYYRAGTLIGSCEACHRFR